MKKCKCGGREFSVTQQENVTFLLDGNLEIDGYIIRKPNYINGLIICENCGKQYTKSMFKELDD